MSLREGFKSDPSNRSLAKHMGLRTYKTTGAIVTALERLLRVRIRATGVENLQDRPTLFVVNHFTRFETLIVPHILYRYTQRPVRTLATHTVFHGLLGRHLRACGVMSTRNPDRDTTIIRELVTRRSDWVIYPEGGLVKSKRIVRNGKLDLNTPHRKGLAHTGAAVLAVKAELVRRSYLKASQRGDQRRLQRLQERYALTGSADVHTDSGVIIPVTITYYPMRSEHPILARLAKLINRSISPRLEEELLIEGSLLLGRTDMSLHFGEPIEIEQELKGPASLARRLTGALSRRDADELAIEKRATKLTRQLLWRIYESVEINFDHLFCYGLRTIKTDRIDAKAFARSLYVAACKLEHEPGVRLHPSLLEGMTCLLTGDQFGPLQSIAQLAESEGVIHVENGSYILLRDEINRTRDFHNVRLESMTRVIANEFEAVARAVKVVDNAVNANGDLDSLVADAAIKRDRALYQRACDRATDPDACSTNIGEPFHLTQRHAEIGVLLAHGYLACPEEMRPLGDHLHNMGCAVYGVRLAGHGTSPEQIRHITWLDWMESLVRGYAVLRSTCPRVVVGGFSLGGLLALVLASDQGLSVDGVFAINPPLKLRDARSPLAPWMLRWNRISRTLHLTHDYSKTTNMQSESPDINYSVNYINGVSEIRRTIKACRSSLCDVKAPALIVQSMGDPVVVPQGARIIHDLIGSEIKSILELPIDRHIIVRGDDTHDLFQSVSDFVTQIQTPSAQTQ